MSAKPEQVNHEWLFKLPDLTEAQACEMAAGYVPNSIKAQLREMLDFQLEDQRRAERPVRKAKA